jgi:regulator of RNase E activity RraA
MSRASSARISSMRWAACTATAATSSTWSARRPSGSSSARRSRSLTSRVARPRSTPSTTTSPISSTRRLDHPAGKVIVLASNGYTDTSMGGGTKLLRLHQNGCAGLLTDGRLRDFDELARSDFAAYCSGEATRWGGDHVTPFQANVPVVLDRVAVMPGHYVFADSSGAVVIPDVQIEEVLAEARKVEAADAAVRDQIAREQIRDKPEPVRSRERRSS